MALNKIAGANQARDNVLQRTSAGTMTGEHITPGSVGGQNFSAIIDDTNTRIKYGTAGGTSATFSVVGPQVGNTIVDGQTQTIIGGNDTTGTPLAAAQLRFRGTSIGVLGGLNPYSGVMNVLVDGVPTAGRLPVWLALDITGGAQNTPIVGLTDTSILAYNQNPGFATNTILLGSELITYTGTTLTGGGTLFTGCTRGTGGTVAQVHFANETIWAWGNTLDLSTANYGSSTDFATKQLLYYNPFLSPGEHSVTIYVTQGATYSRIYFDGFVTGSLVGAQNLFTQTGTVTVSFMSDANGHGTLGGLTWNSSDITVIGVLGYYQVGTESSNTTPLATLAMARSSSYLNGETNLFYYAHNGPISAVTTLVITFTYIGRTL